MMGSVMIIAEESTFKKSMHFSVAKIKTYVNKRGNGSSKTLRLQISRIKKKKMHQNYKKRRATFLLSSYA